MKTTIVAKIGASLLLSLSVAANAANVTVSTPAGEGGSSYALGGNTELVFENVTSGDGIVNAVDNPEGEELIFLGAHETINFDVTAENPTSDPNISVTVNNTNGSGATTGGVSLVLSAAESLQWNLVIDSSVQLNNIYIFGLGSQQLSINGSTITLVSGAATFSDIDIIEGEVVCGYTLPDNGEGCFTDEILGINMGELSNLGDADFLGDLTDSDVTNFNGSYLVDSFNVDINTTAIPVPSALILFSSALALLIRRKSALLQQFMATCAAEGGASA